MGRRGWSCPSGGKLVNLGSVAFLLPSPTHLVRPFPLHLLHTPFPCAPAAAPVPYHCPLHAPPINAGLESIVPWPCRQ